MNDNDWTSLWYALVGILAGAGCYLLMKFSASIIDFLINGALP